VLSESRSREVRSRRGRGWRGWLSVGIGWLGGSWWGRVFVPGCQRGRSPVFAASSSATSYVTSTSETRTRKADDSPACRMEQVGPGQPPSRDRCRTKRRGKGGDETSRSQVRKLETAPEAVISQVNLEICEGWRCAWGCLDPLFFFFFFFVFVFFFVFFFFSSSFLLLHLLSSHALLPTRC
jgi:hypothetical protein